MMSRRLSSLRGHILIFLLIAIPVLLAYSNTFNVPFQFDDEINISGQPFVRHSENFFDPEWMGPGSSFVMRTVGFFSFALNFRIHGEAVLGYHIVNLAIHILNGLLVYFLVLFTFRTPYFSSRQSGIISQPSSLASTLNPQPSTRFIALFAALLFISHPVQTQAVTYIVQRFTSLATLFYLLSLVSYIKFRFSPDPQTSAFSSHRSISFICYLLSFFSAVLAMKTKEIAFTLPLMILLYEFLFFSGSLKKRMLYLVPILLTMLIIPISLMGSAKPVGEVIGDVSEAMRAGTTLPRWDYLFTQFRVIVTYIRLLFIPLNQNLDYDYPIYNTFFDPNVVLSLLLLLALFGLAIYLFYRSRVAQDSRPSGSRITHHAIRLVSFGIFWFFITLSVESSIIPIADVIFEHRLYLPSVGFFISVAAAGSMAWDRAKINNRMPAYAGMAFCILIVLFLSGATYARNNVWRSEVALWEDAVRKSPSKVRSRSNLGHFYYEQGRFDEAIREYETALRLDPDDFKVYNNLGVVFKAQGRVGEAVNAYRKALILNPDDAMGHYNLGNIFREHGQFGEAIRHYNAALRLKPDVEIAVIHNNLGIAYFGQGDLESAEREFRTAIESDPDYEAAGRNLEILLRSSSKK
jgi:protein O-mannosyl-transferase